MAELNIDEQVLQDNKEFVIYLFLDGHRSSTPTETDVFAYKRGIQFFKRFLELYISLGFREIVLMVHTKRNNNVKGRIESVQKSIFTEVGYFIKQASNYGYRFYGDQYTEFSKSILYGICKLGQLVTSIKTNPTIHVLLNYSEEWAVQNYEQIKPIPSIDAVIRFTRGYISGGVIPTKMNKAIFVYSQTASNSILWSDESICKLILITFKNWLLLAVSEGYIK